MGSGAVRQRLPVKKTGRIAMLPTTRLGWWAVGLAAANPMLTIAWRIVPGGGFPGLACGLVGGVVALVAIFRCTQRAITVFAAILPFVLVVLLVLAELIIGHD